MLAPNGTGHLHVVTITFVIPIVATLVMEAAETLVDHSQFDWRERFIKTGWDLCVLALGSGAAIFTIPDVQTYLGADFTVDAVVLTLLFTVLFGLFIALIRKVSRERVKGWHGLLALLFGGTALALQWYIVVHS